MSIARSLATSAQRDDRETRLLTMSSALAIRGLDTWLNVCDIHYRTRSGRGPCTGTVAPAIRVENVPVPVVMITRVRGRRLLTRTEIVKGAATVSLEEAVLDLARFEHPLVAYIEVSIALGEICRFDVFDLASSRARERQAKQRLIQTLEPLRRTRNYRRARTLIERADAAVESIPESVVLWLLHILLRNDRRPQAAFESQYPIVARGNSYRVDAGFPELRLYGEYDGEGKMLADPQAAAKWIARQEDLHSAGWNPFRLSTRHLNNIPGMARGVGEQLRALGLQVAPLGGPLWEPIPSYFYATARRH